MFNPDLLWFYHGVQDEKEDLKKTGAEYLTLEMHIKMYIGRFSSYTHTNSYTHPSNIRLHLWTLSLHLNSKPSVKIKKKIDG